MIDHVSFDQLLAIADGLMASGEYQLAAQILKASLTRAQSGEQVPVQMRLGVASNPNPRTSIMRKLIELLEAGDLAPVFVGEGLATWTKTLPFYDDPRFVELAEKHGHLLPLPNWHWNLQTVLWAVGQARALDGELVELGVFKGHTTLFCAEYVEFADWPKTWRLYDTFDGIPEDQLDPGWKDSNRIYKGTFSFEEVRDRFAHFHNIQVIKGRVPEVLADGGADKIAFLHMDLNNAKAEIQALESLYDRIVPGGIIVFDDYGWAVSRNQYDVENAWFAKKGLQILPLPTGQGLFIKPV